MRVLAFAASNSRQSINRTLVNHATERLGTLMPGAEVELLDIHDYEMPIYSIDRERETGVPAPAQDFFARIGRADAVILSFAEHNGSVTAAWKNVFDWTSRIEMKLWQGRPMVLLAASPGRRAGAGVLDSQEALAPHFGGEVRGRLGIGRWPEAWDADTGSLVRPEDAAALDKVLGTLAAPASAQAPHQSETLIRKDIS
jgi:NAD(P)H-dependent FMN reductase